MYLFNEYKYCPSKSIQNYLNNKSISLLCRLGKSYRQAINDINLDDLEELIFHKENDTILDSHRLVKQRSNCLT